jgi:hypothetical protein
VYTDTLPDQQKLCSVEWLCLMVWFHMFVVRMNLTGGGCIDAMCFFLFFCFFLRTMNNSSCWIDVDSKMQHKSAIRNFAHLWLAWIPAQSMMCWQCTRVVSTSVTTPALNWHCICCTNTKRFASEAIACVDKGPH